jgi:hypothetical protein
LVFIKHVKFFAEIADIYHYNEYKVVLVQSHNKHGNLITLRGGARVHDVKEFR